MSQENVELHRRIMQAYTARDLEAGIGLSDPEIKVHTADRPMSCMREPFLEDLETLGLSE
jgi:hypothetical protein